MIKSIFSSLLDFIFYLEWILCGDLDFIVRLQNRIKSFAALMGNIYFNVEVPIIHYYASFSYWQIQCGLVLIVVVHQ